MEDERWWQKAVEIIEILATQNIVNITNEIIHRNATRQVIAPISTRSGKQMKCAHISKKKETKSESMWTKILDERDS